MCPLRAVVLYIQVQILYIIYEMKQLKLPFIDNDLSYTGVL